MTAELLFAEFIDRRCGLYAKSPAYRRALERERPKFHTAKTHRRRNRATA